MVAVLACSSLLVTSCYSPYPTYGGVAVGMGPGGVGVSASAEWTNASYDAEGYPIYGYSYGRPVYGYTAAGVAIFTLAALTTAYYLPCWGCAHWCHHHDVYIHYCPRHHHKCWAPDRCPRGHQPHVRPPHDGPHPGKGVHVKAPSHRGVPDSGRPAHMDGGRNHGMQPGRDNRGMQDSNHRSDARGMQPAGMNNRMPRNNDVRGMQNGNLRNGARGAQRNNAMQPMQRGNDLRGMQDNALQRSRGGQQPAVRGVQRNNTMQPMQRNHAMQAPQGNRMQSAGSPTRQIRSYGPGAYDRRAVSGSRPSSPSVGVSRPSTSSFGGGHPATPSFSGGGRTHSAPSMGGAGGHRAGGFGGGHHGRR